MLDMFSSDVCSPVAGRVYPCAGFSLIELLVVLVIVSVAMSVIVPRLTPQLSASRLAAATSVLASMVNVARSRAAESGQTVELIVAPKENLLRLAASEKGATLLEKRLDAGARVLWIEKMGAEQHSQPVILYFFPEGSATEARIALQTADGASAVLVLSGASASLRDQ